MTGERLTPEAVAAELLPCHPSGYCEWHAHHHVACVAGNSAVSREQIIKALRAAHAEGLAEAEALKAENTRQAAEVERLRAELACAQESVAAGQGLLRDARAKNTPLRELLRRAVDGLSGGACHTCGAEPGCNIDCAGCRWIAEAEAVLADAHMSGASPDHARPPAVTGTTSDKAPAAPADPE